MDFDIRFKVMGDTQDYAVVTKTAHEINKNLPDDARDVARNTVSINNRAQGQFSNGKVNVPHNAIMTLLETMVMLLVDWDRCRAEGMRMYNGGFAMPAPITGIMKKQKQLPVVEQVWKFCDQKIPLRLFFNEKWLRSDTLCLCLQVGTPSANGSGDKGHLVMFRSGLHDDMFQRARAARGRR